MIKKLLGMIGLGSAAAAASGTAYKNPGIQLIYDLLFCDRLALYKTNHQGGLVAPWSTLFADSPDLAAVQKIAEDGTQESRVRALAFNLLRAARHPVPDKVHLGTIIEVSLPAGIDTLAVFSDGSARYINHTGHMTVIENGSKAFDVEIQDVLKASAPIVEAIGPWDKDRLSPPTKDHVRMSFLVSDGLYFGQGPLSVMQKEVIAAPLIDAATRLLVKIVEKTKKAE